MQPATHLDASEATPSTDFPLRLRVGDWVEVKSAEEILATLDSNQSVAALPFMPEMLQHCGKRFSVQWSAHKTADTIEAYAILRLANSVHLKDLRCDGSAHGGCQAGCLFFWKECWLKRVDSARQDLSGPKGETLKSPPAADVPQAMDRLLQGTRYLSSPGEPERFRCQATEMPRASTMVRGRERWNPLFYVRDLTSGNVSLIDFLRFGALAIVNSFLGYAFQRRYPRIVGRSGDKTPSVDLNLRAGELVRVRTLAEIEMTLSHRLKNRGMWFDVDMVRHCGKGPYTVRSRVERILNEKTGELIVLPNPCIILDGVTCSGNYGARRMFSRRNEYPFWREIWLERISPPPPPAPINRPILPEHPSNRH